MAAHKLRWTLPLEVFGISPGGSRTTVWTWTSCAAATAARMAPDDDQILDPAGDEQLAAQDETEIAGTQERPL
jgi:hypothetical protein